MTCRQPLPAVQLQRLQSDGGGAGRRGRECVRRVRLPLLQPPERVHAALQRAVHAAGVLPNPAMRGGGATLRVTVPYMRSCCISGSWQSRQRNIENMVLLDLCTSSLHACTLVSVLIGSLCLPKANGGETVCQLVASSSAVKHSLRGIESSSRHLMNPAHATSQQSSPHPQPVSPVRGCALHAGAEAVCADGWHALQARRPALVSAPCRSVSGQCGLYDMGFRLTFQGLDAVVERLMTFLREHSRGAQNQALGCRYFSGTNQYSLVNMHWWNDTQARVSGHALHCHAS